MALCAAPKATSIGCSRDARVLFAQAERVFVGRLNEVDDYAYAPDAMDVPARLTFRVRRNYKGEGDVVLLEGTRCSTRGTRTRRRSGSTALGPDTSVTSVTTVRGARVLWVEVDCHKWRHQWPTRC